MDRAVRIDGPDPLTIYGTIGMNRFNGHVTPQIEILDICNRQVDCSALCFVDEFLSSDVMDRLLTERSIEELFRKVWMPACLS